MGLEPGMVFTKVDDVLSSGGHFDAASDGLVLDDDADEALQIDGGIPFAWVMVHDSGAIDTNAGA